MFNRAERIFAVSKHTGSLHKKILKHLSLKEDDKKSETNNFIYRWFHIKIAESNFDMEV
jgi:hypothetical protein